MKTVPTLRVVSKTEAPAGIDGLGVADLPAEVRLALGDIAGVAREGLLAMSVAAGLAVMQAMFDAEISAACGPKGRHDPDRAATRHGSERGSVVLGGRRVPVTRPRARTVDGHEVPLAAYRLFAADDQLSRVVLERMLAGVATRRQVRVGEPVGAPVATAATGTSRSAISRRFVASTRTALAELLSRDLSMLDVKVLMVDGGTPGRPLLRGRAGDHRRRHEGPGRAVGRGPRRTPPWCGRCWPTWSPGDWMPATGCWWSWTAPRPCPPRCARYSGPAR